MSPQHHISQWKWCYITHGAFQGLIDVYVDCIWPADDMWPHLQYVSCISIMSPHTTPALLVWRCFVNVIGAIRHQIRRVCVVTVQVVHRFSFVGQNSFESGEKLWPVFILYKSISIVWHINAGFYYGVSYLLHIQVFVVAKSGMH